MAFADIHGTPLVVSDSGGDGPPVIFDPSEAVGGGPDAYGRQLEALSDVYRVISWRDRDPIDTPADPWDRARLLFDLLDAIGIERAVLCGAADAAPIGLCAALLHPDRVRALLLLHGDLPGTAAGARALAGATELGERLDELAMPVALIHGDDDPARPLAAAHAVAGAVSDPRGVLVVPGAGPDIATSHADLVTDALREHLEALPA